MFRAEVEDFLYHEQHYFTPGDTGVRVFEAAFFLAPERDRVFVATRPP